MFLSGVCLYGPMLLLPLFYQQAREFPVGKVGWLLAPQGVGLMAGLWVAGRRADRIGPRIVALTGAVLASAGLLVFVLAGGAPLVVLSAGLVALCAGLGGVGVAVSATSYSNVGPASIPRATSLLSVVQRISPSFGAVVIALNLQRQVATINAPASANAIDAEFAHTFAWALGFLAAAMVIVLLLPVRPPPRPSTDTRNPESRTTT